MRKHTGKRMMAWVLAVNMILTGLAQGEKETGNGLVLERGGSIAYAAEYDEWMMSALDDSADTSVVSYRAENVKNLTDNGTVTIEPGNGKYYVMVAGRPSECYNTMLAFRTLEHLSSRINREKIEFVGVNCDENYSDDMVQEYLKSDGIQGFPVVNVTDSTAVAGMYYWVVGAAGLTSFTLPLIWLIDPDGNVMGYSTGFMAEDDLYQLIKEECVGVFLEDGQSTEDFGLEHETTEDATQEEPEWPQEARGTEYEAGIGELPIEEQETPALWPMLSGNRDENDYGERAEVMNSYLMRNGDGTYSRIEYNDGRVVLETYDSAFRLTAQTELPAELPLFGGFYAGRDYNFLVFGQKNEEENDAKEVVRIVRYTKDWQRTGSSTVCGANTVEPFRSGCLRMTDYDGRLYVHTSHLMYKSSDGVNHQANLFLTIDIASMAVCESLHDVASIDMNGVYVSHSFNEFVFVTEDGRLKTLSHGDAYPRALVIGGKGSGYVSGAIHVLDIAGQTGNNYTGASVGGFEYSGSCYLVAGNSVDQSGAQPDLVNGVRNIFVAAVDRQTNAVRMNWLTHYAGDEVVNTPQLVKINSSRFMILWAEGESVKYALIDENGNLIGSICSGTACLSDCEPILDGDKVVWYVTGHKTDRKIYTGGKPQYVIEDSVPVFYSIDVNMQTGIRRTEPFMIQVEYELDGGINNEKNQKQYEYGTSERLYDPEREGYSFEGWYTDPGFTQQITDTASVMQKKLRIYAKWEPKSYYVIYSLNYGTNHADNPGEHIFGTSVSLYPASRDGYEFTGWYQDQGMTQRVTEIPADWDGNYYLYAGWKLLPPPVTEAPAKNTTAASTQSSRVEKQTTSSRTQQQTTEAKTEKTTENKDAWEYEDWSWLFDDEDEKVEKPAKVTGLKLKNKKGRIVTAKWNKQDNTYGYEAQIARNKKFKKGTETLFPYGNNTSWGSRIIKKKKTYYVRVRAYNYDSDYDIQYGAWSAVKKIKVKR